MIAIADTFSCIQFHHTCTHVDTLGGQVGDMQVGRWGGGGGTDG